MNANRELIRIETVVVTGAAVWACSRSPQTGSELYTFFVFSIFRTTGLPLSSICPQPPLTGIFRPDILLSITEFENQFLCLFILSYHSQPDISFRITNIRLLVVIGVIICDQIIILIVISITRERRSGHQATLSVAWLEDRLVSLIVPWLNKTYIYLWTRYH